MQLPSTHWHCVGFAREGKEAEDRKRGAKESNLKVGDTVLVKNLLPGNKLQPTFGPTKYSVVRRSGASVVIQDCDSGKQFERHVSHLKKIAEITESSMEVDTEETLPETGAREVTPSLEAGALPVTSRAEETIDESPQQRPVRARRPPQRYKDQDYAAPRRAKKK